MRRFVGQLQYPGGGKTCRQPLQAPGGIFPVGIAARSSEQVYLSFRTFQERRAQLCDKRLVVPHCSRQSGIQSPIIK